MNEKELRAIDRAIKIAVQNYKKDLAKRTADAAAAKKSASSATKTGAANKAKAQGAKAMGAPTSGYNKSTKPKGK